jgi:hypothetical protein
LRDRDAVRLESVEHSLVDVPTVERRVEIPADIAGRCWRDRFDELSVCRASDHDARLPVAGEHHAQTTRIEVELVDVEEPSERMPRDDYLEREALDLVRGVDLHVAETRFVERGAQEILLVIVAHHDGHVLLEERSRPPVSLAARGGLALEEPSREVDD